MSLVALPWLEAPLHDALQTLRGHAVLVHGPRGVGQFEFAMALARGWLCESPPRPCGRCAACRLVEAHTHPDLLVLLPEAQREALGWASGEDAAPARDSKAKPSKDIRVEEVRQAIAFAQTTSARGQGKVLVIHPAERMNAVAANALLKTLEEPPGATRIVLSSAAPDRLLPTIRSRCQAFALALPDAAAASAWLASQGLAQPEVLLHGCGGSPQDALEAAALGIDASLWSRLPALVARGEAGPLAGWPLPRLVEALQKLCHDSWRVSLGAAPRYFAAGTVVAASPEALAAWSKALGAVARHDEHPWNASLMAESLIEQGRRALNARPAARRPPIHSPR
jgi:DNA polymerase-3 subunit delta'